MSEHTPGPWELVPGNEHHGPYISGPAGDIADLYTMSNPLAASTRNGGESYPVPFVDAEANARLITSAPDMLEALREAAETLKAFDPGDPTTETGWEHDELCNAWAFCQVAIAKATGEPS